MMLNSFSILLISILLLQSFSHVPADEQFITGTCKQTTIPDMCKSVLMSDSRSKEATTIQDLSLIAFDIAINSTVVAYKVASDLSKQYIGKTQYKPLSRCAQLYEDMDAELSKGKAKVEQSLFREASELALDAEAKPDTCDSEFVTGNMEDLLLQTNHDLTKTCSVSASLTSIIK